jgi:hypothetical protein
MNRLCQIAVVAGFGLSTSTFAAAEAPPTYIAPEHTAVLQRWIQHNSPYRAATDADCSCDSDIRAMQRGVGGPWKPNPTFHPYYAVGDFNWDGTKDFAVGVVRGKKSESFKFVIFHGPFSPHHSAQAAYVSKSFKLGQSLFFGDPRPLPHMLLVGPFEAEGVALRPTAKGYAWDSEQ